jgi:hypothetical protein
MGECREQLEDPSCALWQILEDQHRKVGHASEATVDDDDDQRGSELGKGREL